MTFQTSKESSRPFTVMVEGNIGSGKTTLLKHFAKINGVETYQEPVDRWRDVKGHNTLALMYDDPKRWSLTFQTFVQLTMVDIHTRKTRIPGAIKMMERSIYSARYCFVENLFRSGIMSEVEYAVLSEWFDWLVGNQSCDVDLIVYLRTSPQVVYERIKKRSRSEEREIPLDYLTCLNDLHEAWLMGQGEAKNVVANCADGKILSLNALAAAAVQKKEPIDETNSATSTASATTAASSTAASTTAASSTASTTAALRHFPLPAPVLVIDADLDEAEMIKVFEEKREEILGRRSRNVSGRESGGVRGGERARKPSENATGGKLVRDSLINGFNGHVEVGMEDENQPPSIHRKRYESGEEKREAKILKIVN